MVPSSKKTIHAASSRKHNLNSQWLPQRAASSWEFVWFTATKKKNRWKEKWRKQSWVWRRSEHNHSESIKGRRGQAVTMREGKKRRQRTKNSLAHTFPPGFKHGSVPWCTGGAGRKKKKKGQTNGWKTRTSCVSTSSFDWPEQRRCSPKALEYLGYGAPERQDHIPDSLRRFQRKVTAAEERLSVMWMWQSLLTARTESRSMKRWRSAGDGGGKPEQMCGVKSRSQLEQEHEGLFVTQSTLQSCDGSTHHKCSVLFFLLPLINF